MELKYLQNMVTIKGATDSWIKNLDIKSYEAICKYIQNIRRIVLNVDTLREQKENHLKQKKCQLNLK